MGGWERLHYWVMGGPWTYEGGHDFAMHGPDKEFYDELVSTMAAGVVGRGGAGDGTSPSVAAPTSSGRRWRRGRSTSWSSRGSGDPGAGKRLFDGFDRDVNLEVVNVYSSPYATHVRYTVSP